MRKLRNTLFVTTAESYLALENQNVVVLREEETLGRFPLHALESILYFGYRGVSPALLGACAEGGIGLCFFTPSGRYLASVCGETRGNVLLRKEQYRISDSETKSCLIARNMILGKVFNSRWILERATRDHPQRVNVEKLKAISSGLSGALPAIAVCEHLGQLRGLEGEAAARYFEGLGGLVLQSEAFFAFTGRNRRPPTDPFNALLSFVYTLLMHDCTAALEGVGLDPYVGFLHRDKPGRSSLALDLMEELRGILADRFVLTLINKRVVQPKQFTRSENRAVRMDPDGRRAVLAAWQERKREEIMHPFLQEKIPWGLVPHAQAMLLSRHIRGDLEAYPPFMWK